jgi:hypothetical protein
VLPREINTEFATLPSTLKPLSVSKYIEVILLKPVPPIVPVCPTVKLLLLLLLLLQEPPQPPLLGGPVGPVGPRPRKLGINCLEYDIYKDKQ